jgi:LmbE family N-acetylglucosaminyl deacetylase
MEFLYLSPHFDDVALSCGGTVWEQVRAGHLVTIWTICAGLPDPALPLSPFARELHARWGAGSEAVLLRRDEDQAAARVMGARLRHFDLPDCIYRYDPSSGQPLIVRGDDDLWGAPAEAGLIAWLARLLTEEAPAGARRVSPLARGSHVDHRLVRAAAEGSGSRLLYYADYPDVLRHAEHLAQVEQGGSQRQAQAVSAAGLDAWMQAVAAYRSQISTFWRDEEEMRVALANYWAGGGGRLLARPGQV